MSNHNDLFPLRILRHVGSSSLVTITLYDKRNNLRKKKRQIRRNDSHVWSNSYHRTFLMFCLKTQPHVPSLTDLFSKQIYTPAAQVRYPDQAPLGQSGHPGGPTSPAESETLQGRSHKLGLIALPGDSVTHYWFKTPASAQVGGISCALTALSSRSLPSSHTPKA